MSTINVDFADGSLAISGTGWDSVNDMARDQQHMLRQAHHKLQAMQTMAVNILKVFYVHSTSAQIPNCVVRIINTVGLHNMRTTSPHRVCSYCVNNIYHM